MSGKKFVVRGITHILARAPLTPSNSKLLPFEFSLTQQVIAASSAKEAALLFIRQNPIKRDGLVPLQQFFRIQAHADGEELSKNNKLILPNYYFKQEGEVLHSSNANEAAFHNGVALFA